MKIIVDGMGGDNSPSEIVKGSIDAVNEFDVKVILVGQEDKIKKELDKYNWNKNNIEILNADEVITNEDNPAMAIRRKKNSSIVVGMKALSEGKGDVFVSAGSTGAILAGGLFIVKRVKGINRAAITTVYPTSKGISLLVDAGANVDSSPELLEQFAIMGSIFMEEVIGTNNPKIGLVNIGEEAEKGNDLTKKTHKLLEKEPSINYIGSIEGMDIAKGKADVIVTDGFVGNIILKLTEGVAKSLMEQLKEAFMSTTKSKIGAGLAKPSLKKLQKKLDPNEYGGAPLLGTQKPIIVAHGSSNAKAIKNAIKQGIYFVNNNVIGIIEKNINNINNTNNTNK